MKSPNSGTYDGQGPTDGELANQVLVPPPPAGSSRRSRPGYPPAREIVPESKGGDQGGLPAKWLVAGGTITAARP